jgi:hypothetical protein
MPKRPGRRISKRSNSSRSNRLSRASAKEQRQVANPKEPSPEHRSDAQQTNSLYTDFAQESQGHIVYPESKYSTDILDPTPFSSVLDSQAQYLPNQQVSVALEIQPGPSLTLGLDNSTTSMDSHAIPLSYDSNWPISGTGYFPDFNVTNNFSDTLPPPSQSPLWVTKT